MRTPEPMAFVPLGVFRRTDDEGSAMLAAPLDVPQPEQSPTTRVTIAEPVGMIESRCRAARGSASTPT